MDNAGQQNAGLTTKQAIKLQFEYGENRLASAKKVSAWKIFGGQFKDMMIMILLASTALSVLMGEIVEALAIIIIVLLNAILGFVQEFRTEKTLEALKNMAAPSANVIRDGRHRSIPASEIVPGDILLLKAGDKVPADARMLEVVALQCDESLLSGESVPVEKVVAQDGVPNGGSMVYMGTIITKGRGTAQVTAIGMSTEMGKIADMLDAIEEGPTPLQKRLAQLGKYIGAGCLGICAVVAATGVLRGEPVFDMLITGISLAVAAVPEGLPAIVTIALALAVNRILKRRALVRRLHSVETMGCANVICTDKTGTLTENKMTVRKVFTLNHQVQVTGSGHEQAGEFLLDGRRAAVGASPSLKRLLDICVECNNAQINLPDGSAPGRDRTSNTASGRWEVNGEPTEIALMVLAAKANILKKDSTYSFQEEIPFDSERKRMTVLVRDKVGKLYSFSKGAPDLLLDRCKYALTDSGVEVLTPVMRRGIVRANDAMAAEALRVLGFAYKEAPGGNMEQDMVFVGMAGMIDPPRAEVYGAVARCRQARIRTVMITGDHKMTACAIARDIGIMRGNDLVMTGAEIDAMPEEQFRGVVSKVKVFARVSPGHKLKIVRALKQRGDIVAMTGDGVNDAPAVKEADIGVSMGISGTDVTKQAASIILLDDNFATLVAAIEEGRVVYANIRKFIRYLLSCNIGEVVTMFVGMLMGLPVVLVPIQILLVNLATDGLPAIALGLEPGDPDIMSQKPRSANDSVFSGGLLGTIVFRGCLIGLATLMVFINLLRSSGGDLYLARTGALTTLVVSQLFHVFECKSETRSIFKINLFNNPSLIGAVIVSVVLILLVIYHPLAQLIFTTVPLGFRDMFQAVFYAAFMPVISALMKLLPKKIKSDVAVTDIQ